MSMADLRSCTFHKIYCAYCDTISLTTLSIGMKVADFLDLTRTWTKLIAAVRGDENQSSMKSANATGLSVSELAHHRES